MTSADLMASSEEGATAVQYKFHHSTRPCRTYPCCCPSPLGLYHISAQNDRGPKSLLVKLLCWPWKHQGETMCFKVVCICTHARPEYHAACKDEYGPLNPSNSQLTSLNQFSKISSLMQFGYVLSPISRGRFLRLAP